jgi:hypothetical protein
MEPPYLLSLRDPLVGIPISNFSLEESCFTWKIMKNWFLKKNLKIDKVT